MHPKLKHQIEQALGSTEDLEPEWLARLESIGETSEATADPAAEGNSRSATPQGLLENDQTYRALANHSPVGIFHADPSGRTVYVNQAWSDLTGLTLEEAKGDGWQAAIHPAHRDSKLEEWREAVGRQGPTKGQEYRILRPDGRIVWVEGYAVPLLGDDEELLGFVGSIYDISGHKEAHEVIRESEEKYRILFEQSRDVVYVTTPEGRFVDINRAGLELFEFDSKRELLEAKLGSQMYADPSDRQRLLMEVATKGSVRVSELHLKTKNGRSLIVSASLSSVKDARGHMTAVRGILHDLTETKQLERQLRQSQKMEAIGRLAGGVAHDFNNLLTAVMGYSDLLEMALPPDSALRSNAQEIKSAAKRGAALTQQLLAFSRRQVVAQEVIEINDIVRGVRTLLARLLGDNVELAVDLDPDAGSIKADPTQLEQIVVNLAINSRDAMPDGGVVTIRTASARLSPAAKAGASEEPCLLLSVSDTGSGIPEDIQDKVFEPFFSTKSDAQGTGLGLATVYGAVQQNGGQIFLDSQLGKGTTFEIYFPVCEDKVASQEKAEAESPELGGSETILIAEDEPAVRTLLKNVFLQHGYQVLTANDGEEALAIAREKAKSIDLVVSDVVMPKLNGAELARTLRGELQGVPIVLLTGYSENPATLEAVSDSLLLKPFSPQALAQRARELLDSV